MTKIVPDFRAYCKQDKLPSYNYLNQDYPIKLPTQTRDEPLFVLDCRADTVIKVIPVGTFAVYPTWQMELNPDLDRLYVLSQLSTVYDYQLWVIDCAKDSVRKVIHLPLSLPLYDAFLSPELEQLWMMRAGYTVIDCLGDSVLADTNPHLTLRTASYDPTSRKVYATSFNSASMYVIDMDTRLPIESLPIPAPRGSSMWPGQVHRVTGARKVYWTEVYADSGCPGPIDTIIAVDTRRDSIITRFGLPSCSNGVCDDRTGNYVYFASDYLVAVDTRTDSVVSGVHMPTGTDYLVRNSKTNRLYAIPGTDSVIQVVYDSIIFAGLQAPPGIPTQARRLQTLLNRSAPLRSPTDAVLFDATGRRAAVLRPGPNDISHLAPGVYFVREGLGTRGQGPGKTRKVVVTR